MSSELDSRASGPHKPRTLDFTYHIVARNRLSVGPLTRRARNLQRSVTSTSDTPAHWPFGQAYLHLRAYCTLTADLSRTSSKCRHTSSPTAPATTKPDGPCHQLTTRAANHIARISLDYRFQDPHLFTMRGFGNINFSIQSSSFRTRQDTGVTTTKYKQHGQKEKGREG